jgi:hypothetical protein
MIETVPLEKAADAYARMMQGKTRFRMELVAHSRSRTECRRNTAGPVVHRRSDKAHRDIDVGQPGLEERASPQVASRFP